MMLPFPEPLSEKYRPTKLGDFVGLEKAQKVLKTFAAKPYSAAWMFVGKTGVGKTTMMLALRDELQAELIHIPSKNCDLATVENAVARCHYAPMFGANWWLVGVDEADRMTPAAQIAWLSILDSTAFPSNTVFVFTANTLDGLEDRFLSRLRVLEFSNYGIAKQAVELLQRVWSAECGNAPAPNLERIVKESNNNLRDALMKLEVEIMSA